MAKCEICGREMLKANGCICETVHCNGIPHQRLRFGDEGWGEPGQRCPDCGAKYGHLHHWGCDVEIYAITFGVYCINLHESGALINGNNYRVKSSKNQTFHRGKTLKSAQTLKTSKTTYFRDCGNGWFRACWEESQTHIDHKSFVSHAPSGAGELFVLSLPETIRLC